MDLVEKIAHILCPQVVQDGPCSGCSLTERGPRGGVRGCIYDASKAARSVLSCLEENGMVVVPRESIERLGSSEAFDVSRAIDPVRDAELVARMQFARGLAASPKKG